MLFTRGLSEGLRSDAMREHPRELSEAIRAARMAQQNAMVNDRSDNRERRFLGKTDVAKLVSTRQRPTERTPQLSEEDRIMLLREGRCFKCRGLGHLAKDCQETYPNETPPVTRRVQSLAKNFHQSPNLPLRIASRC